MSAAPEALPELSPLEMARNCARAVLRYADAQGRDPLGSYIARSGVQGHQAASLAGNMALVSIADDLHRIVGIMTGTAEPDTWTRDSATWAPPDDGAVDAARATREHMGRWAAGDSTHHGEEP